MGLKISYVKKSDIDKGMTEDVNNRKKRMCKMELTKSELEIMNVIWDAKRPLTRGEILDLSVDKKWKDNSIHILLNRLLEKGAIIEAANLTAGSMSRTSPVWTSMRRMFFPAVIRRGLKCSLTLCSGVRTLTRT